MGMPTPQPFEDDAARRARMGAPLPPMPGGDGGDVASDILSDPGGSPLDARTSASLPPRMAAPQAIDPEVASYVTRGMNKPQIFGGDDNTPGTPPAAPAAAPTGTPSNGNRGALEMIDAIASGLSQHRTGRAFDPRYYQGLDDRDRQQALQATAVRKADPNSPESKAARSAWSPYLQSAGWSPEEQQGLSAAQLAGMNPGSLVASRQRLQAEIAQREKADKDKLDATAASNTEWDRRNATSSAQQDERAKMMAGIQDTRATRQTLLSDELAGKRQAAQEERVATQQDKQKQLEMTKEYGLALQKTGIPEARTKLERAEQLAQKLKEKNGGQLLNEGDALKRRMVDLVNQPQGYALLSDPDAREFFRTIQEARNMQIKDQAGGNVTAGEFGRQQATLGSSALNSAEDSLKWLAGSKAALDADETNLLGGFGPEVRSQYQANLATAGKPGAAPSKPQASSGMVHVRDPNSGEVRQIPASKVALAKQRGLEVLE